MSELTSAQKHKQNDKIVKLTVYLKWAIGLLGLLIALYVFYGVLLWIQFSSNYTKWLKSKVTNYSVAVKYLKADTGIYANGLEVVHDGQVTQGYNEFNKPIIEWAFEQAQACVPAWVICKFFSWSFKYDPDYGYPTHIEYHDYDWLYVIEVNDFTQIKP